ncbi:MAG: NAD(P)/FAD-dependent oxidoreductase [Planctomycetota bacterium]|nr:MAG: NAD(P)/FAD-dependent oxidoreductase [Planctomycetota bacterium]
MLNGSAPRVVVLGGGFGGLTAARALRRARVQVTLLDRRNHHLFQPMLYQVATAALAAPDIAMPIRKVLRRQRNATVLLAEARAVDLARRQVLLYDGALGYDFLVIATGVTHSYFGHEEWAEHAPGLKDLADAFRVRARVLLAFEAAEREPEAQRRRDWLRFVIIGGGPTGVELAGALAEIARKTLARDFRNFDPRSAEVLLLEGGGRILPSYPPELSASAVRQLEELGAAVRTGAAVVNVDADGVELRGGERIAARTVLWAAGVQAAPLTRGLGAPLDRSGRVLVLPDLTVPGHPQAFVIGDAAALEQDGRPVPGVAPAAMQMGAHAAASIERVLAGKPSLPFRYRDKGALATIGRRRAVAHFGRYRFSGFLAWTLWLLVHIFFLIGFRNRFVVLFEWAWAYLTYQRSARVILESGRNLGGGACPPAGQSRKSASP